MHARHCGRLRCGQTPLGTVTASMVSGQRTPAVMFRVWVTAHAASTSLACRRSSLASCRSSLRLCVAMPSDARGPASPSDSQAPFVRNSSASRAPSGTHGAWRWSSRDTKADQGPAIGASGRGQRGSAAGFSSRHRRESICPGGDDCRWMSLSRPGDQDSKPLYPPTSEDS
jgi:hypothetical protein